MKKLALGLGAWSVAAVLSAPLAHAVPEAALPDLAPIAGTGTAGAGGMSGFPGEGPGFTELRVVNAGAGIPVGGGLLVSAGVSRPIIEVADAATPNTTLGGTITQFGASQYWVWVPSTPLVPGNSYQVSLSSPDLGSTGPATTFKAADAITVTKPEIMSEPSASTVSQTFQLACCRSFLGAGVLEQSTCFPNEQQRTVSVDPGLITPDPALLLNQLLFRLGAGAGSAVNAQPTVWPTPLGATFTEQAEEYCFELEAVDIVSGTVFAYEDLDSCAPHGDLPSIGVASVEPGSGELDRLICHAPPAGYEDPWCELNEDPCADDDTESGCGLYGHVCRNEPLPPDPFMNTAGFDGFSDTAGFGAVAGQGMGAVGGGEAGSGEGGESGNGMEDGASGMSDAGDGDSGCSVAGAPRPRAVSGALAFVLSAAAVMFAARRRKTAA